MSAIDILKLKYTRGPWELTTHEMIHSPIIMKDRKVIATLPDYRGDSFDRIDFNEAKANHLLIVRAPQMAERLLTSHEMLLSCYQKINEKCPDKYFLQELRGEMANILLLLKDITE